MEVIIVLLLKMSTFLHKRMSPENRVSPGNKIM